MYLMTKSIQAWKFLLSFPCPSTRHDLKVSHALGYLTRTVTKPYGSAASTIHVLTWLILYTEVIFISPSKTG